MGGRELQMVQDAHEDLRRPTVHMAPIPLGGALPATKRYALRSVGNAYKTLKMFVTRDVMTVRSVRVA